MNNQEMLAALRQIEGELAARVEHERKREAEQQGRAPFWKFVYLQLMDDGQWHPNDQSIQAYDIERAFATLGYVIRTMGLTVRDIRYGLSTEMHEEMVVVRSYWDEQIKKHGH